MIPKGIPSLFEASLATSCPTLVILNAVFFIVSQSTSKSLSLACLRAALTTPGPLTPTFITASASVTPWNAPAIKGLSSGALQNTTSFAQPIESLSAVIFAVSFTILPISLTASILRPVFVEPKFTELHTKSVSLSACGIDSIKSLSAAVIPFDTTAEYPPRKLTPVSFAALSRVFAICTKSFTLLQALPPIKAIGVTDILLFTIGTPKSLEISSPTFTRFFATFVILL